MTWGMVAVGGASLVGGMMSADAASSAADKQAASAQKSLDLQKSMFDTQMGLQSPFQQAGVASNNRLSYLLGLSPTGYSTPAAGSGAAGGAAGAGGGLMSGAASGAAPGGNSAGDALVWSPSADSWVSLASQAAPTQGASAAPANFDAKAYLAANPDVAADPYWGANPYQHYLQHGQAEGRQFTDVGAEAQAKANADPAYGSLTKPFSMSDFQLDPGIQFQMQQGNQALQNSQAAKDGVLSGGALKDLLTFNQGLAGTGYQSAFDRYMAGKQFTYDTLSGVANRGQAAASNSANNAGTMAGAMGNTITGAGNAQAAGIVGSANAMSGGISGAGNAYFLSSLLNNQNQNASLGGPVTTSANPGGVYIAPNA